MRLRWVAALAAGLTIGSPVSAQPLRAGIAAPEFNLPALGGGRIQLSKFRGQAVILSFWNTWCGPCRGEFPELAKAHARYAPALVVIGINGRQQEKSTTDVQAFVDEFKAPFRNALDRVGAAREKYRVDGLPMTVFIDTAGIVRHVHVGRIDRDQLAKGIAMIYVAR